MTEAAPTWTLAEQNAAAREGWFIFDCDDSKNGRWQICRIDSPDEWTTSMDEGDFVSTLNSDCDAWLKVRTGTGSHHSYARQFIYENNAAEWVTMNEYVNSVIGDHFDE